MHTALLLSGITILAKSARALEVVVGSQCYNTCGGGSTYSTDLVCSDGDYTSTQYGQKMAACLSCESTSLAVNDSMPNGGTTDEYWFMFNMKYTLQTCVIDSSTKTAAVQACQTECQPLQPVLDTLWLGTTPYANQYDYCSILSGSFPANASNCAACLQSQEGSVVLGNFAEIMGNACSSQPLAQNGDLVSLPRALLDTSTMASKTATSSSQSTSTTSSSSSTSTSAAASTTSIALSGSSSASSTATAAASTSTTSSKGLSTGAAAGIGIGIGLAVAGLLAGLIFWILRRRQQRHQKGVYAPELPAYSYAPPMKSAQEKDAVTGPAVSELGHQGTTQELHGHERYEAGVAPQQGPGAAELDAGRN